MSTAQQNCSTQCDASTPRMTQRGQIVSRQRQSRPPYSIKCSHHSNEDLLVAQNTWLRYNRSIWALRIRIDRPKAMLQHYSFFFCSLSIWAWVLSVSFIYNWYFLLWFSISLFFHSWIDLFCINPVYYANFMFFDLCLFVKAIHSFIFECCCVFTYMICLMLWYSTRSYVVNHF